MNATNVKFGHNVTLYPGVYFWGRDIEIGDNVDIGIGTIIYSRNGVKIGSNTSIAAQCYIIDSNHGTASGTLIRKQPMDTAEGGIEIGEDVWIAAMYASERGKNKRSRCYRCPIIGKLRNSRVCDCGRYSRTSKKLSEITL